MDSMFGEEKNTKDPSSSLTTSLSDMSVTISYTKTNKLITALYIVTDIIDKDEPLRNKLRTLGVEIISDINGDVAKASIKISEVMSFLGIASDIHIISEMNCNILKKEFSELNNSILSALKEKGENKFNLNQNINLKDFFLEELPSPVSRSEPVKDTHNRSTRVGVQKAGNLMKALNSVSMSDRNHASSKPVRGEDFDNLKKERRSELISIIKILGGDATIKDIKDKIKTIPATRAGTGKPSPLVSCGEKTLQRELVSMVKDGVLNKSGEKRWSRYRVK